MPLKEHDLGLIAERIVTDLDGQITFDAMIVALRECRAVAGDASADELEAAVRLRLQHPLEPTG